MRKKSVIALLLIFAILLTGMLVACNDECTEHVDANNDLKCDNCEADMPTQDTGNGNGNGNGGTTPTPGQTATYSIKVTSMAGVALEGVTAFIRDSATNQIVDYFNTDANGNASKSLNVGNYYVEISSPPKGYVAESKYYFNNNNSCTIVLTSKVVSGTHKSYSLGDVMFDFSVNTVGGGTFVLSEALEEYDAVLLNFFYTTCSPCISEFPYLNEAAGMYSDDIAVICVDTNGDTFNQVSSFYNNENGYFDGPLSNLKMGIHEISLFNAFGTGGYPTSVMIDRYGVICLIEVGGLPYLYPFTAMFDYFSADDYTQKLFNSIDELTPKQKPADLGYFQPDNSVVAPIMNGNGIGEVTYYPETESYDAESYWPFRVATKDGRECMVSTNNKLVNKREDNYNTVAAMHVDVTLQQNQALSLDYYCSSERGADYFYVLVDGELIYSISGLGEEWETCYPYVATKDGTYKISFVYSKDTDTDSGDDCIYLDNLSITNASQINKETYIPRNAVSDPNEYNDGYQFHQTVVFNEEDGYYHVGSENGPLLLANLMNYVLDDDTDTATSLYLFLYDKNTFKVNGEEKLNDFIFFCSYASNSEIGGYCTVNEELKTYLVELNKLYTGGVLDESEYGWLRFCRYYDAYGTTNQLEDPIAGLAPFSAYDITLNDQVGLDEYPNSITYKTIIMPRGKLFSFTSVEGGVYRIISDGSEEVDAWIFDEEAFYSKNPLLTADHVERLVDTNNDGEYGQMEYGSNNICMTYYFEPGKEYFIDVAYYDNTQVGTINFKIERLGDDYTLFRYASPGPFTYYVDPVTGEEVFNLIAGGVTPVYNSADGYFYVGDSKLYLDITLPIITGFFGDETILSALEKGIFDFTKVQSYNDDGTVDLIPSVDENGEIIYDTVIVEGVATQKARILRVKDAEGNDTEIRDYSADVQAYVDNMIRADADETTVSLNDLAAGCVAVDKKLAYILQYLVDKTSFNGVPNAWTKLCYYYEYLGSQA